MKNAKHKGVLIDVRSPKEYKDGHREGAINLPFKEFNVKQYHAYKEVPILLVCQTGNRASQAQKKLKEAGFDQVSLAGTHMEEWSGDVRRLKTNWSVDRQFRMTLGILIALFLALYYSGISWGVIIPIILATGLIFTSLIDRCYMREAIAMMPWNRNQKI